MAKIESKDIVVNIAGRERLNKYIVLKVEEKFAFIVDGDLRRVEKPKKKNIKHLENTGEKSTIEIDENAKDKNVQNAKIRKELRKLSNMEVVDV